MLNVNLVLFADILSEAADCLSGDVAAPASPSILAKYLMQVAI